LSVFTFDAAEGAFFVVFLAVEVEVDLVLVDFLAFVFEAVPVEVVAFLAFVVALTVEAFFLVVVFLAVVDFVVVECVAGFAVELFASTVLSARPSDRSMALNAIPIFFTVSPPRFGAGPARAARSEATGAIATCLRATSDFKRRSPLLV
jgi:hypothetical protein